MYVYTVEHDVLLKRPPLGANSLQCFFFFLNLRNDTTLNFKFGGKKCAEKWEFGLASIYKDQNGKF